MAAVASRFRHEHLIVVRHRSLRWEVSVDGVTRRMIDWLCTEERAVAHALELASALGEGPGGEPARVVVEEGRVHPYREPGAPFAPEPDDADGHSRDDHVLAVALLIAGVTGVCVGVAADRVTELTLGVIFVALSVSVAWEAQISI